MSSCKQKRGEVMRLTDTMVITGSRAILKSYAKINLTLDVTAKRADGYHDIESVMQTVSLFDLVIVDKTARGISISTNVKHIPNDSRNIAWRAAEEFFKYTNIRGGAKIMIHKNIPVSAGLAGGSGNGAAVLSALNALYNAKLTYEQLCEIGVKLGADVPYCINGGTQLACGIGEVLTPLSDAPKMDILLVKPFLNISTAAVYSEIDSAEPEVRPDTGAMVNALCSSSTEQIASQLCNVMEAVTEKQHPQIGGIKKKMISDGALGAVMSGSGPTVFGIFPDAQTAKRSADSFSLQFRDTFVVKSI